MEVFQPELHVVVDAVDELGQSLIDRRYINAVSPVSPSKRYKYTSARITWGALM